ncbi:hypothetical protein [Granulicella sibirica]|uniref:Uncharacterized protein n=1 Tax=Granulicella sibirica TaxID=2479048 RepID=A0A4V1L595_9BACT|nr:hypothetical protein [Granulicella sibirica]RXH54984.1 hypothetical protein GRAN_4088 [Granulicella sibirica]
MRATEEQDQLEKAKAEQLIAEAPLMEGVASITVELGDDFSGDPAMWVNFNLIPGFDASREWIRRFVRYETDLALRIVHSGVSRFPYTRFGRVA